MQNIAGTPFNTVEIPDLQRIEIQAKALELSLKKLEIERLQGSTVNWSIVLPLVSAVIAVISAVVVAYLNGKNQIEAEHYKSQTTLIVEAVKTGTNNPSAALNNLQFFADAGLLDTKVVEAVGKGKSPVLPAATSAASGTTFQEIDRKLQNLHPSMRAKVTAVLNKLKDEGIPIALYEGFREPTHQQYFYLQGRINRVPIRTDDPPWRSYRQYGLAVTFGVFQDGAWSWKYDDASQKNWWDRLKTLALNEGLELSGTEPSGYRLAGLRPDDLMAGRYPEGDKSWADNLARAISNWTGEPAAPPLPHTATHQ